MIGHCLRYQNEIEVALAEHEHGALASTQVGNRLAEMTSHESAGMLLVELGRYADAIAALEKALHLSRQIGSRRYDAPILVHLGAALCETGRAKEGRAAIDEALTVARETGMGFMGPLVLGLKALYAGEPAESRTALAEAEPILKQGCVGHNYFWFYRDATEHSLQRQGWDEALRYAQALDDYTVAERLPWSDLVIARGRALARHGRGERSPDLTAALQRVHRDALRAKLAPLLPRLEAALA